LTEIFLQWLDPGDRTTVLARLFQNHSGRVIAFLRLVLATIFLLAVYFEPTQPVRLATIAIILLVGYLIFSIAALVIAWRSWWHDFRLAWPAWLVDVSVFAASIIATEGGSADFNSPFLAFFVFLMVSATLRWHWRATALAASAVLLAYIGVGFALTSLGLEFNGPKFARRTSYMVVIGMVFVTFAMQRGAARVDSPGEAPGRDALKAALRYALQQSGGGRGIILWEDRDEPAVVAVLRNEDFSVLPASPDEAAKDSATRLFDRSRDRELILQPGSWMPTARKCTGNGALAATAGIDEGLSSALMSSGEVVGTLVLADLPSFGIDDLERTKAIAHEVVGIIQGRRLAELARDRAVTQTREALARDLHDSVAQSLAGASFGLEALRRSLSPGETRALKIMSDLKQSLREEQANIREMIDRLRRASDDRRSVSLSAELGRVVVESRGRWDIDIDLAVSDEIEVPAPLVYECKQIIREAIANGVRHGQCSLVEIDAIANDDILTLRIRNNGRRVSMENRVTRPWTIDQRVTSLGGTMALSSDDDYTSLCIDLPKGRLT